MTGYVERLIEYRQSSKEWSSDARKIIHMCHMLLMVRVLDIHINVYISRLIYVNMKNVEYCKNNSKCYELMNFLSCPCKFISIFLLLLLICSMLIVIAQLCCKVGICTDLYISFMRKADSLI